MVASIPSFRTLFDELDEYEGSRAYAEVLLPWLPRAQEAMSVLGRYGDPAAIVWRKDDPDPCSGGDHHYYTCLEHLYAASRVSDLLLVPFEPVWPELLGITTIMDGKHWQPGAVITEAERCAWWQAVGMNPVPTAQPFHPYYHEVVAVEQAEDPSEPISVMATHWTGFMLGQMMFARAGVTVRGGREHIIREVAEHSRLYWTYWRNNRHAIDRSHGWGHNSQWSTRFRRDYVTDDAYHYHVDGVISLLDASGQVDPEATSAEVRPGEVMQIVAPRGAVEIMTHRCLITEPEGPWEVDLEHCTHQEPRRH